MTKQTYFWAVDTLLDAYNEGRLFHGKCAACAVGTLLQTHKWAAHFLTVSGKNKPRSPWWDQVLLSADKRQTFQEELDYFLYTRYEKKGFTREELEKIEREFEMSIYSSKEGYEYWVREENRKQGQYIGLCAVLKVMESMVDEDVKENNSQERLDKIATEKYHLVV